MSKYVLTLLFSLVAAAACSQEDTAPAERVALEWLRVVDSGEYAQSWEMTGSIFRGQVTAAQWAQSASAARAQFGSVGQRKVVRATATSSLPNLPSGDYVVMQMTAEFDGRTATETVTAVLEDGQWRVIGYFIR